MNILLINPRSPFLIEEKVFPPLGILYIGAYLKSNGYKNISVLDMCDNKIPKDIDFDIVGMYSNTPQFPEAFRVMGDIRKLNKNKNAVYVFGGPHVSGRPTDIPSYAIAVVGEGEKAILDIVKNKEQNKEQDKILRYSHIKDIDEIPFPDRDLIDIKSYKYYINNKLTTTVITSRGCPFSCGFCANNVWGKSLRMRSPENIADEIKFLIDRYGYKSFMFFDDTMTVNKSRMLKICSLLKPLDITYRCFIRSDTVNYEILKSMKDSGCVEVGVGIESGSQRILDIAQKSESVETNIKAIQACHDAGLRVKGFLIVGLPGENAESINETKRFLDIVKLDDADFTIFTPYPGSIIYENRDNYDISFEDNYKLSWYKGRSGEYRSLVSTSSLSENDIVLIREDLESIYKNKKIQEK